MTSYDPKVIAAAKAVELIKDGMVVGLGSGTTASLAIEMLGKKVNNGLKIIAVASSVKSAMLAAQFSIPLLDLKKNDVSIDIAIDGADEVDGKGNLIKGGGGSLLREKIVAYASRQFHVIVDEGKLVEKLGSFPLAVEVTPFAVDLTLRHIRELDCSPVLRRSENATFTTDNGNFIADCKFEQIADPAWLDVKLKMIPGVVETGLFSARIVTSVIIGYRNGQVKERVISP